MILSDFLKFYCPVHGNIDILEYNSTGFLAKDKKWTLLIS